MKYLYLLSILFFAFSCSDDESLTVLISDLTLTIDENPDSNQVLTEFGNTADNSLTFVIAGQSIENAIGINSETGELFVANNIPFDFETNPTLTAVIEVIDEGITTEVINLSIQLINTDNCVDSNQTAQNELISYANASGYIFDITVDLLVHEYTFTLSENRFLCSIAYQGIDNLNYRIEILDSSDTIVYSNFHSFSSVSQDVISIDPVLLNADEDYILRRTIDENLNVPNDDKIGPVIRDTGSNAMEVTFPIQLDDIVIIESKFFDNLNDLQNGNFFQDNFLPFMTLGFE